MKTTIPSALWFCRIAAVALALAALPACLSLSPENELNGLASLIEERATTAVDWEGEPPILDLAEPLDSDTAVRIALHHHPRVRGLLAQIAESRADLVQAHLLPNPSLTYIYGFPTDGGGGAPAMANLLIQQLSWLWQYPARTGSAEADLRARVLEVSDRSLRLVAEVRSAHARLVHAERVCARDRTLVDLLGRGRDLMAERFRQGEATQGQVNSRELILLEARDQLLVSAEALALRRRELLELLGVSEGDAEGLRSDDVLHDGATIVDLDEGRVMELAAAQRLDVNAAYAGIEGAEARTRLASLERIPEIGGGVAYQRNFENRDGIFPSVTVTPKIFDTGKTARARAEAIERRTLASADALLLQAIREARAAWVGVRASGDRQSQLERETIPVLEQDERLASLAFDAGTADLLATIDAGGRIIAARRLLDDLELAVALRLIELERAVGGTLSDAPLPPELAGEPAEGGAR